jgi:drug/metabolite transporter (DMT)-like permease
VAYVLAVLGAMANAVTTILQRMGVESAPADTSMRLSLLAYALRRKVWLVGFGVMICGFLLQAFALHFGPLTVVQPIFTLELPFLIAILWFWFGQDLTWREWFGAVGAAGGLSLFLIAAHPGGGTETPDTDGWVIVILVCAAAITAAVLLTRIGSVAWKAAMFGSAAAINFALTAAFIKQMTDEISARGWGFLATWPPYAVAVVGVMGVFLVQNAFHAGPVTASQATLVIVDPLAAIAIGIGLFGDSLRTSVTAVAFEVVGLSVMFAGVLGLALSPLIAGVRSDSQNDRLTSNRRWHPPRRGQEGHLRRAKPLAPVEDQRNGQRVNEDRLLHESGKPRRRSWLARSGPTHLPK